MKDRKRRGGRPQKAPEKRHSEALVVMVTPALKSEVASASGTGTEGMSGWVRDAIVSKLEREKDGRSPSEGK